MWRSWRSRTRSCRRRLAKDSTDLHLGQVLSSSVSRRRRSRTSPSRATSTSPRSSTGRDPGFKEDIGGQRVIETDAVIIEGNSGRPVFDDRGGQVIGAATFTSFQGEQVVQGSLPHPGRDDRGGRAQGRRGGRGATACPRGRGSRRGPRRRDLHYRAHRNMSARGPDRTRGLSLRGACPRGPATSSTRSRGTSTASRFSGR